MNEIKCIVVGDGSCGKTCMIATYKNNEFPTRYHVTVSENFEIKQTLKNKDYLINVFDVNGSEDFELIRSLVYKKIDVILVCFDVSNVWSFQNIKSNWKTEVEKNGRNLPIVLVGTKTDLRYNNEVIEKLAKSNEKPISREQGELLANEINAVKYIECSALNQEGLKDVFNAIVKASKKKNSIKQKLECNLS